MNGAAVSQAISDWRDRRAAAGEFGEAVTPRSVAEGAVVELREVTAETARRICALVVAPEQRGSVAPNAVSLAEAMFQPKAWFRAIYADDEPVGFAMLSVDPEAAEYGLWRLMIADGQQRRGYGAAAMRLLVDHVRALPGATELLTSWMPGPAGPEAFYLGLGFESTGEVDEGEVVGRLRL